MDQTFFFFSLLPEMLLLPLLPGNDGVNFPSATSLAVVVSRSRTDSRSVPQSSLSRLSSVSWRSSFLIICDIRLDLISSLTPMNRSKASIRDFGPRSRNLFPRE